MAKDVETGPLIAWHGDSKLQDATVAEMARLVPVIRIFEHLPNDDAMKWPERFLNAAKSGADLSLVQWKFLEFVLDDALSRKEAAIVREACRLALEVVRAKARGEKVPADAARRAAAIAAAIAAAMARSAAAWAAWAEIAVWKRYADKLVELMAAAPQFERSE